MTPPASNRPHTRGFTLLEVLVAVAVIAIAMAAVIKATGAGAANSAYLRDKTLAHWVAMNQFAEMKLDEQPADPGREDGKVEMAGRDWFWFAETEETPEEAVLRVELSVHLDDDRDSPSVAVLTGFLSTLSQPAAGLPQADPNQPGLDAPGTDPTDFGSQDGLR